MIPLHLLTVYWQELLKNMFNFFKKKENNIQNPKEKTSLKDAVSKTSETLFRNFLNTFSNDKPIDEYELDDIETTLIKADLGVDLALEVIEKIKKEKIKTSQLKNFLKTEFTNILDSTANNTLKFDKDKINVYLVAGVNGAGKTTTIGKLAHQFKTQGQKVLIVAGDTFRAAAQEQLDVWAKRAGVDILMQDKADSASLAYRSIDMARNDNYNVVLIDTAGRLQNKFNLIEELKKIKNVIYKKIENDNLETILVLDGTQGQNGLNQAMVFNEALDLSAVAITKLDGSPKGGIIFSIAKNLKLPTKLIGIGEKIDDLIPFKKEEFIEALFD